MAASTSNCQVKRLLSNLILLLLLIALSNGASAFTLTSSPERFPGAITQSAATSTTTQLWMKKSAKKKKGKPPRSKGFAASSSSRSSSARPFVSVVQDTFPYAGSVRPGVQSPQRVVPADAGITRPDYADSGSPKPQKVLAKASAAAAAPSLIPSLLLPWMVEVKDAAAIQKMRAAGRLARQVLDLAGRHVKPGVTTDEIDTIVHEATVEAGAYPSPLNYHGFPKSCCTSVNEVICHGIPDDRTLENGDIINVDVTVYLDGYHGDCSEMFVVGEVDEKGKKLLQTTYDCWISACQFVKPGRDYKDIGAIIEDYVVRRGFSTVRNFCGHGIGQTFHTNPNILHYRNNEPNGQMTEGHTFTIEPMICEGSAKALTWPDEWTATTVDGKRSAQFEHTLLVTPDGVEALTGKNEDSPIQFWERESEVHKGIWLGTSKAARERQEAINQKLLQQ